MSLLAAIRKLWRSVAPRTHSDVEEEFRSTLDAYQEDLIRQGLPEEKARRKARIDLGQPPAQNETYRDAIGLRFFDELGGDLRYGLRALRRNPGFAGVAVLSLALGIGATTAMFSLIYAVLLHPFPYAGANRIMNPVFIDQQHPDERTWFLLSKAQFDDLRLAAPVDSALGFNNSNMEITGGALPEEIWGIYLTENAGTFFGVRPLLGRNIEPSDAKNGGQSVVVLNYRFWQRHFGGDPHVVGRTAPSHLTKLSSATRNTAASGSSPYCLASSLPSRSPSRWLASSASSPTASRSVLRSSASASRSARRARTSSGLLRASRSSALPRALSSVSPLIAFSAPSSPTGCKAPLPQVVCSQPSRSSLSARSSPACCRPATPSPSHPPKLSVMSKACPS
jgi:hypothetical protein